MQVNIFMQISISIKQMPVTEKSHPRFRVELTDGVEILFGVLGVEQVSLQVQQGLVGVGSIIKVMQSTLNAVKDMT